MFIRLFFLLIPLLFPLSLQAANDETPLPVNQAFKLSIEPTATDSIILKWQMAPNYYLYKDRISIKIHSPKAANLGNILLPPAEAKTDKILGSYWVYEKILDLPVPLLNPTDSPLKLLVSYQGCAAWGFCYPPQLKLITLKNLPNLTLSDIAVQDYIPNNNKLTSKAGINPLPASEQTQVSDFLKNKNIFLSLSIFFGLGLLLSFTPCVLPMIPIISSIIIGHGKKISPNRAFSLSLSYVFGMALSFAIAGILVSMLGSNIQAAMQKPWIIILFSLFFVALAISLFGFYEIQMPKRFHERINALSHKQKSGSHVGVFVMGILSSLVVSPCVSAPLVGVLTYVGQTGNALFGGLALFILALGMGCPLILIGASFGKLLPHAGHWMQAIKTIFGFIMLAMAFWLLGRIIPDSVTLFLFACLAIVAAMFMGALSKTPETSWGKLWKGLGIVLLTYGVLLIVGAAMGNSDLFNPLQMQATSSEQVTFIPVKSIADVEKQIKAAKKINKPVMLDFYADWCIACKEMEKYTFSENEVRKKLSSFVLIRADVTANNATDKQLLRHFSVIAPPTILFFDTDGKLIPKATIVGAMNAQKFLTHIP